MKRVYATLFLIALGLIVGIVEKQGDPLHDRHEPEAERLALTMPCAAWICKDSYEKCKQPTNRRCTSADYRGNDGTR